MNELKKYNLVYINGGKVVETVIVNGSKVLCLGMRRKLKGSDRYRMGTFIIEAVR